MTEAAKILQMIESVSIDDTDMLDEIDELTVSYLGGKVEERFYGDSLVVREETFGSGFYQPVRKYTRSRDAIKSIRPDGWCLCSTYGNNEGCATDMWKPDSLQENHIYAVAVHSKENLPTEELAELHAVIQAIDYERQNDE